MATTFDIGSNVRRLREERGISLSALARKAGVSKAYLSQMENDPEKRPSVEIVHQLAQALHVRLTELIGLEEPGPAGPPAAAETAAAVGPAETGAAGAAPPAASEEPAPAGADSRAPVPLEPGHLPPGLRIFWNEHPELPLEEVRMLAAVAQCTGSTALSATDYWLLHETIRLVRRRRAGHRGAPA